jgi:hypothetical protein
MTLQGSSDFSDYRLNFTKQIPQDCIEGTSVVARRADFVAQSDDYVGFDVIEFHIRRRTAEGNRRDLCAVFDFTISENPLLDWPDERGIVLPFHAKLPSEDIGECELKQAVLVRVIEFPQQCEQRREIGVRAIVRLRSLNRCSSLLAKTADHAGTISGKLRPVIANGKLQFVPSRRRILTGFVNGNGVNEMIEGTSEIMGSIANYQRPVVEPSISDDLKNEAVFGQIGIDLCGQTVRTRFQPGANLSLDGFGMVLRPSDFCVYTGEV